MPKNEIDKRIERLENLGRDLANSSQKPEIDLSPLLALSDSWFGSDLLRSYQRPKTKNQIDRQRIQDNMNLEKAMINNEYRKIKKNQDDLLASLKSRQIKENKQRDDKKLLHRIEMDKKKLEQSVKNNDLLAMLKKRSLDLKEREVDRQDKFTKYYQQKNFGVDGLGLSKVENDLIEEYEDEFDDLIGKQKKIAKKSNIKATPNDRAMFLFSVKDYADKKNIDLPTAFHHFKNKIFNDYEGMYGE